MGALSKSKELRSDFRNNKMSLLNTIGNVGARLGYNTISLFTFLLSPFTKIPTNVVLTALKKTNVTASSLFLFFEYGNMINKYHQYKKKFSGKDVLNDKEKFEEKKLAEEIFLTRRKAISASTNLFMAYMTTAIIKSIIDSGAAAPPDDEDRELLALSKYGGRIPGRFNISHYLRYLADDSTNKYTAWKKDDISFAYPNAGSFGFALTNAVMTDALRNKNKRGLLTTSTDKKDAMSDGAIMVAATASSLSQLSLLQGYAAWVAALTKYTKADESGFMTLGTTTGKTLLSPVAPNFWSFFERAEGDQIDNLSQYYSKANETDSWKVIDKVWTSLSGRVLPFMRSPLYRAAIGPLGEDLKKYAGLFKEGSIGAHIQMALDPFSLGYSGVPMTEEMAANQATYRTILQAAMIYKEEFSKRNPAVYRFITGDTKNSHIFMDDDRNEFTTVLSDDLYRAYLRELGSQRKAALPGVVSRIDLLLNTYNPGDSQQALEMGKTMEKQFNELFSDLEDQLRLAEDRTIKTMDPQIMRYFMNRKDLDETTIKFLQLRYPTIFR
jgi:hypothetical protein